MRIIAGQARGMTLNAPRGNSTRPMDGRAREALFNILFPRLEAAAILDLYAGTGSLGLEALSRGAASCIFVEKNRKAADILEDNLERSGLAGGEVICTPCSLALKSLSLRAIRFSLVFYDPPFPASRTREQRNLLIRELGEAADMLKPEGLIMWRLERRNYYQEELPDSLREVDRREYGRSLLIFASRRAPSEDEES